MLFCYLFLAPVAFNISLCFKFLNLISISVCSSLGLYCMRLCSLDLSVSFPKLGKFSAIISSKIFSDPLSHHLLGSYNVNVGMFHIVPDVPYTVLISFHSSFIPLLCSSNFYQSVFQLTYSFFSLIYSTLDSL